MPKIKFEQCFNDETPRRVKIPKKHNTEFKPNKKRRKAWKR